jgi:hypothetical protein
LNEAGIRTEPPVSEPAGANRAATPAPVPPEDPTGTRLRSYGLCAIPANGVKFVVVTPNPSSCMFALPSTVAPADSRCRSIIRVKGKGLLAKRTKSRASQRGLLLPRWCVTLLRARRARMGEVSGPLFRDSRGGWRDRSNVGRAFRSVRAGSNFEWVKTHTYRKTVATTLDAGGLSARLIADQLGHARISMTQDVYLGRRAANTASATALEAADPDTDLS